MITRRKFNPVWIALIALLLASLACSLGEDNVAVSDQPAIATPSSQQSTQQQQSSGAGLNSQQRANLISGTVRLLAMFPDGDSYSPAWVGSGTILSPDGYILTNSHVAKPSAMGGSEEDPPFLMVGLVQDEAKAPVYSYIAKVVAVDGYLDLALVKIVGTADGSKVNSSDLNLPYVELGNSDDVHIGDPIYIFGFPGIGGETITYTDGKVSGFTPEDQVGDRAYFKTDATISGGNSGGLAANGNAEIIGVPTSLGAAGLSGGFTGLDCRPNQDTNGDGQIDDNDVCVPISNFLADVRSINLAKPLILAAENNQEYSSPYSSGGFNSGGTEPGSGNEQFSDITWVTVDNKGNVDQQVDSYPSGTDLLVGLFDYAGMTDGQTWGVIWYQNGQEYARGSFSWDGGSKGTMPISLSNNDNSSMEDGTYSVEVYLIDSNNKGTMLTQGEVTVGGGEVNGGVPSRPSKSDGVQISGQIVDNDTNRGISGALFIVLNPGVTIDQFEAKNFPDSMIFTMAQADSNGNFTLPDLLDRGTSYTVVVGAKGYQRQVFEDVGYSASDSAEQQYSIPLTKQ